MVYIVKGLETCTRVDNNYIGFTEAMISASKGMVLAAVAAAAIIGGSVLVSSGGQPQLVMAGESQQQEKDIIPLTESKLIIEHNAKDKDTGFQGFIDSEDGWKRITVTDPNGKKVLDFSPEDNLGKLGLTELFFESAEPENADVPINELLKTLPEGNYTFSGFTAESAEGNGTLIGTATFSHDIPEAPAILSPEEDAVLPNDQDLHVSWSSVDKTINGSDANIIAYQLTIEKDQEPDPHMIGTFGFTMNLPPSVTQITIPKEVFEPGSDYSLEVLAIEENGNQSINSTSFSTSD
jgi:hypothetical protein